MSLRPYQQEAVDAALSWIKTCLDPAVIEAPTGSGKSHIIAGIANGILQMSGKKILVIAPSGELVDQNFEKYRALGEPASIYSASLKSKDMRHEVIFGSPLTVSNSLRKFGHQFAAIVIDEAHGITPTVLRIVEYMQSQNPKLRVIGLSATPYRLGEGYIYGHHYEHGPVEECTDPFFHSLIYTIDARSLIDQGFLTAPIIGESADHYDTSGLQKTRMGTWDAATVDRAFVGKGRLTSDIVADVVDKSAYRRGVMFFAATIEHAHEIMDSLPPSISRIVTGKTPKAERDQILEDFKSMRIKYLVNVSVLTTGFDAPHVDVIAILRATESAGLLQQIMGRGLRVADGKDDCLILDYAENVERHFPDGDIFAPQIRAARSPGEAGFVEAKCIKCATTNIFSARPNPDNYGINEWGYFVDLADQEIMTESGQDIPAHMGRRCNGQIKISGRHERCDHRWSVKVCPSCEHENDISARYCEKCRAEIVDPNEKLRELSARMASDPYRTQVAEVLGWRFMRWPGKEGNPDTLRITYEINANPWTLHEWHAIEHGTHWSTARWERFCERVWDGDIAHDIDSALDGFRDAKKPGRVAYKRKKGTKFYEVTGKEW